MKYTLDILPFKEPMIEVSLNDLDLVLQTDGTGYWSKIKKKVKITHMEFTLSLNNYGELQVFFDEDYWNTSSDGLIYTDKLFIEGLNNFFKKIGLSEQYEFPDYSEHGMQGTDYVSLDIDRETMNELMRMSKLPKSLFYVNLMDVLYILADDFDW